MRQQVPQLRFSTMRLASGPRVHYAEQGDPNGEPIVFLPAYTDSWFSYSRVLSLLPPRYHAYALDQRGHGDSERPDCCYTVEDFAGDVAAFLDAVGAGRATLVGHSGSCLVARCVAEIHPERVARLVLIGAPGSLGDNERSWSCRPRCAACGRRRTSWRSPFPGPGWSCTRRRATAPTGSAQRGLPPTSTPSYGRGVADPPPQDPLRGGSAAHRRPGMREGAGAF
jgi:pimeloyl-ACP methyl ester carboxylesterase